jgi:DNA ligase (NAD+)
MIGQPLSRRLVRQFGTMQALPEASVADLQHVDSAGPERAVTIAAEPVDLASVIGRLVEAGRHHDRALQPRPRRPDPGRYTDRAPATVEARRLTDDRCRHRLGTRVDPNESNEAVETLGGKSSGSVSKRTDLVVVGDGAAPKPTTPNSSASASFPPTCSPP